PLPEGFEDQQVAYPHTLLSYSKFLVSFENDYQEIFRFPEGANLYHPTGVDSFDLALLFKQKYNIQFDRTCLLS
ncbi:MAG: hypothetical protein ACREBW_03860, partial [Candidatus Micrarchaeaceae archaeon]